jgi:hypothetical protein
VVSGTLPQGLSFNSNGTFSFTITATAQALVGYASVVNPVNIGFGYFFPGGDRANYCLDACRTTKKQRAPGTHNTRRSLLFVHCFQIDLSDRTSIACLAQAAAASALQLEHRIPN